MAFVVTMFFADEGKSIMVGGGCAGIVCVSNENSQCINYSM
jgi:hypothetical protein